MPPKMKLPSSYRPTRRSQRVRKLAAASSTPVTIVIDPIQDVSTVVEVPAVAEVPAVVEDFPAVAEVPAEVPAVAEDSPAVMPSRSRQKSRGKKKQKTAEAAVFAAENVESIGPVDAILRDDCEVFEDCDSDFRVSDEDDDGNRDDVGVDEAGDEFVRDGDNFEAEFGEVARELDEHLSDEDSGDDIWEDGIIPDPVNSQDESEDEVDASPRRQSGSQEEYLRLGMTFNCPEDFKRAVLRYSLKIKYDIVIYRSQSRKIGAKCSDSEGNCQWRCYCSYDKKKKKKMQIKVCVRAFLR